ncbi:hypothetical protein [Actinomadura sp. 9N215]|uniref:hypothetical protein n=1 Tax=Actinomadura sp. 9N215 TaxID=3375150 RepID=UPI003795C071
MARPAVILRKTWTAAAYVHTHAPSGTSRRHAAAILRALADVHAAANGPVHSPVDGSVDNADPPTLRALLDAVAECAGPDWLRANTHDPDIGRLTALLDGHHRLPRDLADLDDLLATVLWTRHAPQPAPP